MVGSEGMMGSWGRMLLSGLLWSQAAAFYVPGKLTRVCCRNISRVPLLCAPSNALLQASR